MAFKKYNMHLTETKILGNNETDSNNATEMKRVNELNCQECHS